MSEKQQLSPQDQSLRHHPYRILIPLGWALAWLAAMPHVLYGWGLRIVSPREVHSLIFLQGVLLTFAAGFLFTLLPRQLHTSGPKRWQVAIAVMIPPIHASMAWQGLIRSANVIWLVECLVLFGFCFSRIVLHGRARSAPSALIWILIGFLCAFVGGGFEIYKSLFPVHTTGAWIKFSDMLVEQGMFLAITMGVCGMIFPLTNQISANGEVPSIATQGKRYLGHLAAAVMVFAGFWQDANGNDPFGGYLAAGGVACVWLCSARLYQWPFQAGAARQLAWLAAWCIPLSLVWMARNPYLRGIGEHMFYLGGLLPFTLGLAIYISRVHNPRPRSFVRPQVMLPIFGALILLSVNSLYQGHSWTASNSHVDDAHSAAFLLAALVISGALLLPRLLSAWRGMTW